MRSLRISRFADEAGLGLVEILVAALVLGVAVVGVAMMFGTESSWVAAIGEDRVAAAVAQQRIEQVRADTISLGWTSLAPTVAPGITTEPYLDPAGCDPNDPDPLKAAKCRQLSKYERVTCIQYVNDADDTPSPGPALITPAYTADCPAGAATSTRRITVTVRPVFLDNSLASHDVERAKLFTSGTTGPTLQAWITQAGT